MSARSVFQALPPLDRPAARRFRFDFLGVKIGNLHRLPMRRLGLTGALNFLRQAHEKMNFTPNACAGPCISLEPKLAGDGFSMPSTALSAGSLCRQATRASWSAPQRIPPT